MFGEKIDKNYLKNCSTKNILTKNNRQKHFDKRYANKIIHFKCSLKNISTKNIRQKRVGYELSFAENF